MAEMDYDQEKSICPENYPHCLDPEIVNMEYNPSDAEEDEPIILDDYRVDKTKPDITYINPKLLKYIEPCTKRSIKEGLEIFNKTYPPTGQEWLWEEPPGPFISLVTKREWGAITVSKRQPIKTPVKYVRFSFTGTRNDDYPQCAGILQELQKEQMEKDGLPDISYNFYIGRDGQLYEGRGWYVDADRPDEYANLKGNCLDIAYLGDYKDDDPSWIMMYTGLDVIRHGIETKVISPEYKVIPYRKVK